MTLKSRQIDVDHSKCCRQWFTVFGGPPANVQDLYCNLHGVETLADTSPHPYLTGGEFTVLRSTVHSSPAIVNAFTQTGGIDYFYNGKIFASQYANNNPQLPQAILRSDMLGYGVKGWNRFKPTSRQGSLAQAIFELKDLPTMVRAPTIHALKRQVGDLTRAVGGTRGRAIAKTSKDLAGGYLNAQFGWLPMLNDVRQLVNNAMQAQRHIDQLARDNGRWIRRSGTIHQASANGRNTIETGSFYSTPNMPSGLYAGTETRYWDQYLVDRFWFSARFKYWIQPVGAGRLDRFFQAEHVNRILYGLDLDPSLVYELTPWSWLVDWFSSAGDSIANMCEDPADNLVADYAYVMGSKVVRDDIRVTGKTVNGQSYYTTQTYLTEVKMRTAATPYGFYAITPDLSDRQVSILAALGITKGGHGMPRK